jgi:hypothetical protein
MAAGDELQRLHVTGNDLQQPRKVLLGQYRITPLQSVVRHFTQGHSNLMKLAVHRLITAERVMFRKKIVSQPR